MASGSQGSSSAREQARKLQQAQEKKQRNQSLLLRIGVVVLAVAVIAGLTMWVFMRGDGENYTEGPAPAVATSQGGIKLTSSTEIAEGDDVGTVDAEDVSAEGIGAPREAGEPPALTIFTDPNCPACANFEGAYQSLFAELLDEGLITLEYHSVNYLPSSSNYSNRAGNAFVCMAEESPENYKGYLSAITAEYQGQELDNDGLAQVASERFDADIASCIEDGTYRPFIAYATNLASAEGVQGTPTIYLNDQERGPSDFLDPLLEEIQAYAEEEGIESDLLTELEDQQEAAIEQTEREDAEESDGEDEEDDADQD